MKIASILISLARKWDISDEAGVFIVVNVHRHKI